MAAAEPALTVRRSFPRPDPAHVRALTGVAVGWIVDAMGRQGALDHRIRPITPAAALHRRRARRCAAAPATTSRPMRRSTTPSPAT